MVDHDEETSPTQQVLCGLHELGQGDGEFMPCYGLLWIRIEAPVANGTVGRIAHDSTERARGKERRYLADVTLDNADAVSQAIAGDILLRQDYQRALQFQPHEAGMRETAGQQERHDATTGAQIDERIGSRGRHKVCEQESFKLPFRTPICEIGGILISAKSDGYAISARMSVGLPFLS